LDSGDRGPPAEPGGWRMKVFRCCYGGRALLLPEEAERCRGRKLLPEAVASRGGGGALLVGPCPGCIYILTA
jgi:hypothetical protein